MVGFHVSLLDLVLFLLGRLCSPCEVPHHSVGRKSFVFLKLRKPLWKQRPQNNLKQGWFYGAFEFLTPLGSECDFSAPK